MQRHSVAQQYHVSLRGSVAMQFVLQGIPSTGFSSAKKASQGAATMCNMMQHMQPGAA